MANISTVAELVSKRCVPCEGGVAPCDLGTAQNQLERLASWKLSDSGKEISRTLRFKNFSRALECLNAVGQLAESEGHHPDLHLTGYRLLTIDLTTHAIGGLSENDFIVAAKIDRIVRDEFPDAKVHA